MIRAKYYEKLSKFVKVTAKTLSVLFSGHGVYNIIDKSLSSRKINLFLSFYRSVLYRVDH